MYSHRNLGVLAGIAAGIFWGSAFLIPMVLVDFTAFEIMFGRFVFFGMVSIFYLPRILRMLREFTPKEFGLLFLFSASGYWLYTFVLFLGIKYANGVIASLILGCMPLTISLFSKPLYNLRFSLGLLLICIGMGFLLWQPLWQQDLSGSNTLLGIVLLFAALSLWTWFGIYNSRFMHKHLSIKALDYSSTMGLFSLLIVSPIFIASNDVSTLLQHKYLLNYLVGCAILGVGASWLANILWVYTSKNCPTSIVGALLISETLFALLYSFIYAARWPYTHELIAIACLGFGVYWVVNSQTQDGVI